MELPDYSILDRPELLDFIFYPRKDWTPAPSGATDYLAPVDQGVSVSCRLYFATLEGPSILFFHGNGEVACDYDAVAPLYQKLGANLFVADYRGYGRSGGRPSVAQLMSDSHALFRYFREIMRSGRFTGGSLVMGRSLGSYPAVELAFSHQKGLRGIIIESGFASIGRLLENVGFRAQLPGLEETEAAHMNKVRSIQIPALVLHGDRDFLVPLSEGKGLYAGLGAADKRLVVIEGAGHNDIMLVGLDQYFSAIGDFVRHVG